MKLIRNHAGSYRTKDWRFTAEKRSSWWVVRERIDGKRVRESRGTFATLASAREYITAHSAPKFDKANSVCVSSNYFGDREEAKTDEALAAGKWVCFCADCIGHTRAAMFESNGERYVMKNHPDALVHVSDYGTRYFHVAAKA